MRLTTKGLLLIAIPALFELALLSGLVKAQSDAALAERWAIHSEDVLRQSAAILDPVLGESVALRGAVLANDTHFATPVAVWVDVDRRIDQLAELVADNPAQVERVVQVRQAVQAHRQWSDRIQDLLRSGLRMTCSNACAIRRKATRSIASVSRWSRSRRKSGASTRCARPPPASRANSSRL